MGAEFIPSLDEGDIALHAMRIPGTSMTQSTEMQHEVEKMVLTFDEVKTVFSKIGTPEVATDPMPPNVADTFVILKPREEWPDPSLSKAQLVENMEQALEKLPGNNYEFTQPIQMRFNELISGVRSDLAVKLYGDDLGQLLKTAQDIETVVKKIEGAADVKVEQTSGLPTLSIIPDRKRLDLYGLNIADVQDVVQIAMGGREAGQVFEGDRRFDLVVRLPEKLRTDIKALEMLPIPLPNAEQEGADETPDYVPLKEVADLDIAYGHAQISRENGKRRIFVTANVRGRDLGSFVQDVQTAVREQVDVPAGYWVDYGGNKRGNRRRNEC
jgi:cobalt-zinc-cadmium resistance protein CzcA